MTLLGQFFWETAGIVCLIAGCLFAVGLFMRNVKDFYRGDESD